MSCICLHIHTHRLTCEVRVINERLRLCLCPHVSVLDLLEKVLRSSSHPHLFDDLLVEKCSFILQFTAARLSKWITSLSEKETERKRLTTVHIVLGVGTPY